MRHPAPKTGEICKKQGEDFSSPCFDCRLPDGDGSGAFHDGIRHKDFPWPKTEDPRINEANKTLSANQVKDEEWPYWGFTFDYNPVNAEWSVISALVTEKGASFNLGMFGANTEAELATFVQQLNDAGLEKYMAEWNAQRDAFLAQ